MEPARGKTALLLSQPLVSHWLLVPSITWWLARAFASFTPLAIAFPPGVHLLGLRWLAGTNVSKNGVGVWLQSVAGSSGGLVDLATIWFPEPWSQTSLDFGLPISVTRASRLQWRSQSRTAASNLHSSNNDNNNNNTILVLPNSVVAYTNQPL